MIDVMNRMSGDESVWLREMQAAIAELETLAPEGFFLALHIRNLVPFLQRRTYRAEWLNLYDRKAYMLHDPVVTWGFTHDGVIRWADVALPDPLRVLEQARAHGLHYGVVAAHGPMESRSLLGVSRADREVNAREMDRVQRLLTRLHDLAQPPDELTEAEAQALRVLASGKRLAEGAADLGISESALKARLSAARKRLMARTNAEAIDRARQHHYV
jgi:LuxR family transcriptional regulator